MSAPLEGRVVAVAGAAGGLGPSVVEALAAAGATVALTDTDEARLAAVGADLPPERIDRRVVDLLDEAAARAWAAALTERFGAVHGLAHLVGGWKGGAPIEEAPLEEWTELHDLLVRTTQHTSRAFTQPLIDSGAGRFVLISSIQATRPSHTNAAYATAKAAAEAWTFALADRFANTGATANVIAVNAIATPKMRAGKPADAYPTFTRAEDIAAAIVYLCGDGAAQMNGHRLVLHGARTG